MAARPRRLRWSVYRSLDGPDRTVCCRITSRLGCTHPSAAGPERVARLLEAAGLRPAGLRQTGHAHSPFPRHASAASTTSASDDRDGRSHRDPGRRRLPLVVTARGGDHVAFARIVERRLPATFCTALAILGNSGRPRRHPGDLRPGVAEPAGGAVDPNRYERVDWALTVNALRVQRSGDAAAAQGARSRLTSFASGIRPTAGRCRCRPPGHQSPCDRAMDRLTGLPPPRPPGPAFMLGTLARADRGHRGAAGAHREVAARGRTAGAGARAGGGVVKRQPSALLTDAAISEPPSPSAPPARMQGTW